MAAKQNLELVEELQQASRDQDYDRFGDLLADDAVFRMAGVPGALGGVTTGRRAIVEQFRANAGRGSVQIKQMFGVDRNVCVVAKVTAEGWPGNEVLRGSDRPYSTYECIVYRITNGKVAEATTYINWLDPYVQVGLVDVNALTT